MTLLLDIRLEPDKSFQCSAIKESLVSRTSGRSIIVLKILQNDRGSISENYEYVSFRLENGFDVLIDKGLSYGFLLKKRETGVNFEDFWAEEQCEIRLM
jgi:hypothetical protein